MALWTRPAAVCATLLPATRLSFARLNSRPRHPELVKDLVLVRRAHRVKTDSAIIVIRDPSHAQDDERMASFSGHMGYWSPREELQHDVVDTATPASGYPVPTWGMKLRRGG